MFDYVKYELHPCAMDNMYNSTYFCGYGYNHKKKLLCHGVTRKVQCGIPDSINQVEVEHHKDQLKVFSTVKATVLEGDPGCPNLVVFIIYDTNPVHYLSMVTQ